MNLILLLLASLASAAPLVGTQDLQPSISINNLTVQGSVSGQLTIAGSTLTVTGQDASGYSLSLSSSVKTQCVTFGSNGTQCAPAGNGTGDVVASANNTFTGNNVFKASSTFSGIVVGNNVIHNSSITLNFPAVNSTGNTTLGVCFATVTITTSGTDRLRVWYSGQLGNDTSSRFTADGFLFDGKFDTGLSAASPIIIEFANSNNTSGSFSWITSSQTAGTHSACFAMAVNAGTGSACASVQAEDIFTSSSCQFGIEEVK